MNILHHVKTHGKKITLHLKKHHKKYIFGILSATLLWKGIGLIATYAVIHNISFSFADAITGGNEDPVVEIQNTNEEESVTNENEITNTDEESNQNDSTTENDEETETDIEDDTIIQENIDEYVVAGDNSTENEIISNEESNENDETNNNNEENLGDETNDENTETAEENNTTSNKWGNGICDYGDIRIISPKQGDVVGKTFDISREFTDDDCKDNSYIIKLRDQNDQYLDIFSGNTNKTGFSFDSTQIMSGFYNITGLNESGDEIIVQRGKYAGIGTNYFSGHKIAIVSNDGETVYRNDDGGEFTIDNKAPEISRIKVTYSTNNSKLNIGDTITISFESDEELKKSTVSIMGQNALLEDKNGNKYKYTMDFSENNTLGKVVYGIEYEDMIGNKGYVEGYENTELDYTKPTITDLGFTVIADGKVKITINTNKKTDANLIYQLSGTSTTNSAYSTGTDRHRITLDNIKKEYEYNYSISTQDEAKNTVYIGGKFNISGDKVIYTEKEIDKSEVLTDVGFTGKKEEINIFKNNFAACASEINTKSLKIAINKQKNVTVHVPEFNNSAISKMTNAFIAVLFEKVEKKKLPQYALDEINEDLDKFLLVVKLVKDDNNECKQNMSQYYVNRFKNTLITYGILDNETRTKN